MRFKNKYSYNASIDAIRLKLAKLRESDKKAQEIIRQFLKKSYEKIDKMIQYLELSLMLKIIWKEHFNCHHTTV